MPWKLGPYLLRIAILAGLYYAAGVLGLVLAFDNVSVSPVWPPAGLALAVLLIMGPRYWPGITVGAFLVNVSTPTPSPFVTAAAIAIGNTLEAVIGAWLITQAGDFRKSLDRLKDVLRLIFLGAMVSTMVSASIGVITLCIGDPKLWPDSGQLWWQWWVGDAMGDLVVAPMLLVWCTRLRFRDLARQRWEGIGLLAGLLCTGWIIFGRRFDVSYLDNSYWLFPFLIWAALRFGPRGIVTALLLISALAIVGTLKGNGPFVRDTTAADSLVLLQMFLGIATITGLILASSTAERAQSNLALRQLNDELEVRVADRTRVLAQTNRELDQKNEENETFVYSVSHDLRSPLVNLQGFSKELDMVSDDLRGVLCDQLVPDNLRQRGLDLVDGSMAESIQFIQHAVVRLGGIIDALLRLSRAGRVEYRLQQVDLNPVVTRIVATLNSTIVDRGATVHVDPLPSVWGDPTAVEQIFANLIGNALNYLDPSRPGVIRVGTTEEESGSESERVCFVRDNGLGIAELHQAKLFQAFQRLHPDVATGEGMGLTFVRRMVERHGGRIYVESAVGVGSTFFVTLPDGKSGEGRSNSAAADSATVEGTKLES